MVNNPSMDMPKFGAIFWGFARLMKKSALDSIHVVIDRGIGRI